MIEGYVNNGEFFIENQMFSKRCKYGALAYDMHHSCRHKQRQRQRQTAVTRLIRSTSQRGGRRQTTERPLLSLLDKLEAI